MKNSEEYRQEVVRPAVRTGSGAVSRRARAQRAVPRRHRSGNRRRGNRRRGRQQRLRLGPRLRQRRRSRTGGPRDASRCASGPASATPTSRWRGSTIHWWCAPQDGLDRLVLEGYLGLIPDASTLRIIFSDGSEWAGADCSRASRSWLAEASQPTAARRLTTELSVRIEVDVGDAACRRRCRSAPSRIPCDDEPAASARAPREP